MIAAAVGDVVYAPSASGIEGDVVAVEEDQVTVVWRQTQTVESPDDLVRVGEDADEPV